VAAAYDGVMYWHHGGLFLVWLFGVVTFALLVGGAVYVAAGLARGRFAPPHPPGPPDSGRPDDPLAILRLRYARGEIGRDEFLRANEDLGGGPTGPAG
jgi:uncharacterized membrane protein